MESLLYCLKMDEAVLVPKEGYRKIEWFKKAVWIVVAVIVLASFVFRSNIFAELSWTARLLLIFMAIGTLFINTWIDTPSPVEIQFYETYLIVFRPKFQFTSRIIREEINIFRYSEITKVLYKKRSNRLHIYGNVSVKYTNYDSNGIKGEKPTEEKTVDEGGVWIRLHFADNIDIVSEIESHSPLHVTVENS